MLNTCRSLLPVVPKFLVLSCFVFVLCFCFFIFINPVVSPPVRTQVNIPPQSFQPLSQPKKGNLSNNDQNLTCYYLHKHLALDDASVLVAILFRFMGAVQSVTHVQYSRFGQQTSFRLKEHNNYFFIPNFLYSALSDDQCRPFFLIASLLQTKLQRT